MNYQKSTSLNPQVCKVEILDVTDSTQIILGQTRIYRSVLLKSGKTWQLVYSTPGKVEFSEEQAEDPGGPFFNQKVEFPYPGEDITTRQLLDNLENQRLLVVLTLASGVRLLLGDQGNPCLYKSTFSNEKGGRIVNLSCKAAHPAYLFA